MFILSGLSQTGEVSQRLINQSPESNFNMINLKYGSLLLTRCVRRTKYVARGDFNYCLDDILKYDWSKQGLSSTQLKEYLILFLKSFIPDV